MSGSPSHVARRLRGAWPRRSTQACLADGTRIPLIVVSPFTRPGHISHEYSDHVSILKFIERNWRLRPVTYRSRDNFPNPIVEERNPYVPLNSPAIGDLFDLFDFPFSHEQGD